MDTNLADTHQPPAHEGVNDPNAVEQPEAGPEETRTFGSDCVAEVIRALGIPYVALNPGASFRGLHDSLVNHLGNRDPRILLCLHEEHAVALAHGWAKVTERPMAAALHSNVGLMHGAMAIYNAWCDRVPMLVLGATGPVDAAKRRPWIDWLHTARDQGALVRHYTKWDDQPASPAAAAESLLRANLLATTKPCGPVYVNLDAAMQEEEAPPLPPPEVARYRAPASPAPDPATLQAAAEALRRAKRPLILAGRVSRGTAAWDERIRLAERLGAAVLTDLKQAAAFPSRHPLHCADAGMFPGKGAVAALAAADVVLSLDWNDLSGTLTTAGARGAVVIQASMDQLVHNGWSMDHQGLPPTDHALLCTPEAAVPALLQALGDGQGRAWDAARPLLAVSRPPRGWQADRAASGRGAGGRGGRRAELPGALSALLVGRVVDGDGSALHPWLRWRGRHRLRRRHGGGRGPGPARHWAARGSRARRRRLPHGLYRPVDRSPLWHSAADRHRQQPQLL